MVVASDRAGTAAPLLGRDGTCHYQQVLPIAEGPPAGVDADLTAAMEATAVHLANQVRHSVNT